MQNRECRMQNTEFTKQKIAMAGTVTGPDMAIQLGYLFLITPQ